MEDIKSFERDVFLIAKSVVDPERARQLINHYPGFFNREFPPAITPEKWTLADPEETPPKTRWGEKAWRSDPGFSVFSLRYETTDYISRASG